mmetsp:Transcript_29356/g.44278  ORF Transcript_29356/g.44278 Transcript_29356/m.44278 type:complete len:102 (-) Transcript_29356:11617-11922(-)
MNLNETKGMTPILQNAVMTPLMMEILKEDLEIDIKEKVVKNAHIFVSDSKQKTDHRVSYKFYVNRYEQLIEEYPNEPYHSDLFFQYDQTSIHYKVLKFFDD